MGRKLALTKTTSIPAGSRRFFIPPQFDLFKVSATSSKDVLMI